MKISMMRVAMSLMKDLSSRAGRELGRLTAPSAESLREVDWEKWVRHFERNKRNRPEPDWDVATRISPGIVNALLPSLEQFELGDGGGPACLIAFDAEAFRSCTRNVQRVVDAWFEEEKGHARLLGRAVDRFGGKHIKTHWSFSAFCAVRRFLGVRFELETLLLTEIVSSAYYRVLKRNVEDRPLKEMCALILRDEAGHIAFHLERLAAADRSVVGIRRQLWEAQFWLLGFTAATVLWVNHGPCLWPLGATNGEFYREVRREIFRFVLRLKRRAGLEPWNVQIASH